MNDETLVKIAFVLMALAVFCFFVFGAGMFFLYARKIWREEAYAQRSKKDMERFVSLLVKEVMEKMEVENLTRASNPSIPKTIPKNTFVTTKTTYVPDKKPYPRTTNK